MRRWLEREAVLATVLVVFALLLAALSIAVVVALLRGDQAIRGIQQSRLELCRQQNARHDGTVRALDKQIAHLPVRVRMRAINQRAGTVALIDALAPKRPCGRIIQP